MFRRRVTQARAVRATPSQSAVRLDPLRAMPLERTIAWGPALVGDARPSRPSAPGQIFITPDALRDVRDQIGRDGAGSLGYFVGERFRDADSKEPWVLVDAVIPVAKQPTRTPISMLLDATFEIARTEARGARRHVVGWYHSAECSQPVLTAADTDAHERHFAKSHSFMLMVAIGRHERQAALFRPSLERGPVPFYELLEPDAGPGDGERTTAVSWPNYFTVDAVARESPTRVSGSHWAAVQPPPATQPVDEPPPEFTHEPPQPRVATAEVIERETQAADARSPAPEALLGTEASSAERRAPPVPTPLSRRTPIARARVSGATPAPVIEVDQDPVVEARPPAPPVEAPRAVAPATPAPSAAPTSPTPLESARDPVTPIHRDVELVREAPVQPPRATVPGWPTRVAASEPYGAAPGAHPAPAPQPPFRIIDPAVFDSSEYRWWHVRAKLRPILFGGLGGAALVALLALGSGSTPALWPERTEPTPTPITLPPVGWAANAASSAVARYRTAELLLNEGRLSCPELARALVGVEQAWITYSIERAAMSEPLDARGVAHERRLESDVAEIEQHFRASECPRP